jgi:hypothetical protein
MLLANRVPQRAKNVLGGRGDKVRLVVGAFVPGVAGAAALARRFFDIQESQSTSEMTAIMFGSPGATSYFNHEDLDRSGVLTTDVH